MEECRMNVRWKCAESKINNPILGESARLDLTLPAPSKPQDVHFQQPFFNVTLDDTVILGFLALSSPISCCPVINWGL